MATGDYGIIYKTLWRKKRFICLTQDARELLSFFFTGDPSNLLGLFYFHIYSLCGEPAFAADEWSPDRATKALNELIKYDWIQYDFDNKMLLVNHWFKSRNIISVPQLKKALGQLANLTFTPLLKEAVIQLRSKDCKLSRDMRRALKQALTGRLTQDLQEALAITETGTETGTETEGDENTEEIIGIRIEKIREVATLFNKTCLTLPQVRIDKLNMSESSTRIKNVTARIKANPEIKFWEGFFKTVSESSWLTGKVPGKNGSKPFRASFDWILQPTRFIQIIEGNFTDPSDDDLKTFEKLETCDKCQHQGPVIENMEDIELAKKKTGKAAIYKSGTHFFQCLACGKKFDRV